MGTSAGACCIHPPRRPPGAPGFRRRPARSCCAAGADCCCCSRCCAARGATVARKVTAATTAATSATTLRIFHPPVSFPVEHRGLVPRWWAALPRLHTRGSAGTPTPAKLLDHRRENRGKSNAQPPDISAKPGVLWGVDGRGTLSSIGWIHTRPRWCDVGEALRMSLDDVLVILLAGGAGERLHPLTAERAKPGHIRRALPHRGLLHHAEDQRDAERQQCVRAAARPRPSTRFCSSVVTRRPRRRRRTGRPVRPDRGRASATTRPVRSTWPRSASCRPHRAFCSTTSTVRPWARSSTSRSKMMSTRVGASPSVGSSSSNRRGVAHQRSGDRQLLRLATRQVAGGRRPPVGEDAEQLSDLIETPPAVGLRRCDPCEPEVLLDGQVAEDPPPFRHHHHAHPRACRRVAPGDVVAVEANGAARRSEQSGDRVQQRRLAGAVGTDEGDDLTRVDTERHGVQRRDRAVTRGETIDLARVTARGCTWSERCLEGRLAAGDGDDRGVLLRAHPLVPA